MPTTTRLNTSEIAYLLAQTCQAINIYPWPYPPEFTREPHIPAAVLIPFLKVDDQWHILFIHRTAPPEDRHGGQVAFPGGRGDPDDENAVVTALREAEEEMGIKPEDVLILGQLPPTLTITNYLITPVVGVLPWPYKLRPAPEEVEHTFNIPLSWLAEPSNHFTQLRSLPQPYPPISVDYFQPYEGEILWGASARITLHLLEALKLRP
ncbi:MAG: CoA pyrophosphatase [Chloroflexota bacterium]